jgi:hypothetical protein
LAIVPLTPFADTIDTEVTEPVPLAVPLDAEVIRPYASTVIVDRLYVPGVTAVVDKSSVTVPSEVIGEPVLSILPVVPLTVTEVTVPVFVVYPAGLVELYGVYPSAVVTCPLVKTNVPPSVKLPAVVTAPLNVSPLTEPVPLTEVTVPDPVDVPLLAAVIRPCASIVISANV